MSAVSLLLVIVSGYMAFSSHRQGGDPVHSVADGIIATAVLQSVFSTATVWLSGAEWSRIIEDLVLFVPLTLISALVGAWSGSIFERREPVPRW
jgi:hypothetical protein